MLPIIISMIDETEKPIPTVAQPEKEFNIEIAIGISALPTGKINKTPNNSVIKFIVIKMEMLGVLRKITLKVSIVKKSKKLNLF